MIRFTIPIKPFGKQRPRHNTHTDATYTPKETADYEEIIKMAYMAQCRGFMFADDVPIEVYILAEFAVPKSASKRKKAQMINGQIRPTKPADVDNIAKIVLDGLQGVCYKNDSRVVKLGISKIYSNKDCITVEVREALGAKLS